MENQQLGRLGRLVVLSGEAGAGKDAVAKVLIGEHGYVQHLLSDEMKKFAARVFGWSDEQLWGQSKLRNEPDPMWARPCWACKSTGVGGPAGACIACGGEGMINDNSPRRVLQLLGEEWGRQMIHPDIWTLSTRDELRRKLLEAPVVVTDARYSNDRQNLARWFGGSLVDIVAPERLAGRKSNEAWRVHSSETDRPGENDVDFVLVNDEEWPFPSLSAAVGAMLQQLKRGVPER